MVLLGYAIILTFVVGLIFLSEKILAGKIEEEYCRKVLHIGAFAVLPVATFFLGTGSIHFVVICAIFSVATLFLHFGQGVKAIERREQNYPGIFYYALSLLILSIICYFAPAYAPFFHVAFIGLAIGDGFATLVGYTFKGPKIYKKKTIIGFIACFGATLIALAINNAISGSIFSFRELVISSFSDN